MKTTHQKNLMLVPLLAGLAIAAPSASGQATEGLDRTVLPIREPQYPPITELDARNAKAPPRFEIKAPAAAPNVVIVLLDDIGFGHSGAFGGPCNMPTLDPSWNLPRLFQATPASGPTMSRLWQKCFA